MLNCRPKDPQSAIGGTMQTLGVMAIHRGAAGARFGLYTCCAGFDSPALHFSLYQIFWGIAMNILKTEKQEMVHLYA